MTQLDAARQRTVRLVRDSRAASSRAAAGPVRLGRRGPGHRPLAQRLLDEGWLIAPGSLFHATPTADHADARELRRRPGRPLLAPAA
jgi:hypothetical protein